MLMVDIERCFDLVLPSWQPPSADGLVALVAEGTPAVWAERLLVRREDGLLVWAATSAGAVGRALTVARLPEVRAVVVLPGRADARRAGLALEFAVHLRAVRGDGPGPGSDVTSPLRPDVSQDVVRVPHLVSVRHLGVVTDTVVWEVMDRERAQAWSGGSLPDQRFIEEHLCGLLELRAAVRMGRFPVSAAGGRLARVLAGRPLSIRVVYQRPGLFHALLADPRPTDPGQGSAVDDAEEWEGRR
jgi:hypothetical protein